MSLVHISKHFLPFILEILIRDRAETKVHFKLLTTQTKCQFSGAYFVSFIPMVAKAFWEKLPVASVMMPV